MSSDARTDKALGKRQRVLETIIKLLYGKYSGEKIGFNKLFKNTKTKIKVSRAYFSSYLSDLVDLDIVGQEFRVIRQRRRHIEPSSLYYANSIILQSAVKDLMSDTNLSRYNTLLDKAEFYDTPTLKQEFKLLRNRLLIAILRDYFIAIALYDIQNPKNKFNRWLMEHLGIVAKNAVKEHFKSVAKGFTNPDIFEQDAKTYRSNAVKYVAKLYMDELNDAIDKLERYISDK